jgi:phage minor structural protein
MIPILYEKEELLFNTNGIGRLTDCISCTVTEERNGIYELEMQYPADGKYFDQLTRGKYIYTTHDEAGDGQAFRIYKISKPINGICTYSAQHISYQLSKIVVKPFTATSCSDAIAKLKTNSLIYNNFNFYTDKAVDGAYTVRQPSSIRALLGGEENSLLDRYGTGELEFDMFDVKLWLHRGTDTGVTIRYGKNLTNFNMETDYGSTYTAIAPFWADDNGEEDSVYLPEGYLVMSNVPTYASTLAADTMEDLLTDASQEIDIDYYDVEVVPLDLSQEFDEKPTVNELRERALQELQTMTAWRPSENITVNFVQLWQTEEYADYAPLQRVKLCDTVSVYFTKMGVTAANMKVIRVVWDALQERYLEMELGEPKQTLTDVITATVENKIQTSHHIEELNSYVTSLTEIITNGMGLFSSKETKSDGGTVYYLHNMPKRSESKYQWTINAGGFAVSQDYGRTWSAGIDADGNAVFNILSANIIKAMEIHGAYIDGARFVFAPDSKGPVTAKGNQYNDGWGGVLFDGGGDFTVSTGTIGLTAKGRPNAEAEFQIIGDDGYGHIRNFVQMTDTGIYIAHYTEDGTITGTIQISETSGITLQQYKEDGTSKVLMTMHPENGLGIWFDGVGYDGLGFVNDGNGHAVLGK